MNLLDRKFGDTVSVRVRRDDGEHTLTVSLSGLRESMPLPSSHPQPPHPGK